MPENLKIFDNHGTINVYDHTPQQSKSEPLNARFESWRLERLKAFCFDHNLSLSECVRDSTDLYQRIFDAVQRARRAGKTDALVELVNSTAKFF